MRIWSMHPSYLDRRALVACWRETLLAQKVLRGLTRGYRNHPQLIRWRSLDDPLAGIGAYLTGLHNEALARNYSFNFSKIICPTTPLPSPATTTEDIDGKEDADPSHPSVGICPLLEVSSGQLEFEMHHLIGKIAERASNELWRVKDFQGSGDLGPINPHPVFHVVSGPVADFEKGNSQQ